MKKHYSHFHDRTGEEIKNNQGLKMKIIVYNGSDDILVKFEDGYKVKTQYGLFAQPQKDSLVSSNCAGSATESLSKNTLPLLSVLINCRILLI